MVGKPIWRNWIILIAIIAIPSILAYQYLEEPFTIEASSDISEMIKQSQTRAQSDSQTEQIIDKKHQQEPVTQTAPDMVTVDEVTTDNGVRLTAKEVIEPSINFYDLEWDTLMAYRAENVLREETQQKVDKVIYEFTKGGLSPQFNDCQTVEIWYEFYYFGGGRNLDGLWSYNQKITDFLQLRLNELGCSYFQLPEGNKEKLDEQEKAIEHILKSISDQQSEYDRIYGDDWNE